MKTICNNFCQRVSLVFLAIMLPLMTFADTASDLKAQEEADRRVNLYMEVACGVVFIGSVIVFIIWKTKHDKKMRERQMEQMKKIQAAKRKAA
ncbi:MAG TPA: hypothetical protein VNY73_09645 [Bacteroidia bacterium]|nr:hypothetical protein [Bacteroidia bacterium]